MATIEVKNLVKHYRSYEKEPGLLNTFKSFFHRKYKEVKAVNNISFEIPQGQLVGFIGPNGAGKTTTLKCLSGLLYPTSGDISVLGFKPWERNHDFLKNIAFVMGQKNQLWWDLPPSDIFLLNKEIYSMEDKVYQKNLDEMTALLDAKDLIHTPTKKLSLGQRMKCELIAALLHKPKVLFLDEPTIGLDVVIQKNLREFIKEYNRRNEATIVLTSHYMRDVEKMAQRVIIINFGKIIFDGTLTTLIKKHSPEKLVTVFLKEPVRQSASLKKIAPLKSYNFPKVIFKIQSVRIPEVTARILNDLRVSDLTIEDPDIEDVIREIFSKKS